MNNTPQPKDLTEKAVLFTHQFTTLISAGVPLVKALLILEAEAPPPYAEAMHAVRMRIEEGETLTRAIVDMPELFPPFYQVMIKAGEVGGILEITLAQTADLLQQDWTLSQMIGVKPMLMAEAEEAELSPSRQTLQLLLFCRTWGSMLSSGVPILQAMEVAAESLRAREHEQVMAARDVMVSNGTLEEIVAQMTFLPPCACTLVIMGMRCGELDKLLLKAAELYRYQLIYQRQVG